MRTSVRAVFEAAAAAYGRGNPLLLVEREETAARLPVLAGRDVLDLGAGPGHWAAFASRAGAARAVAVDVAEAMARTAPRPALVADAGALPFRATTFDVVVASLVLSWLDEPEAALSEARRVLRPGGLLVVSDLHHAGASLGWSRTFDDGRRGTVGRPWTGFGPAALESALQAGGFATESSGEAVVDERLRPSFVRAGRRDFDVLAGTPLLVFARARRDIDA